MNKIFIREGLLIAAITAIFYFSAFEFKRGFLEFFGVSDIFIGVSVRDISIFYYKTLQYALILFTILAFLHFLCEKESKLIFRNLHLFSGLLGVLLIAIIAITTNLVHPIYMLIVILFLSPFIFYDYILPIFQRNEKTYLERLENSGNF
jgi:hypothetical protein